MKKVIVGLAIISCTHCADVAEKIVKHVSRSQTTLDDTLLSKGGVRQGSLCAQAVASNCPGTCKCVGTKGFCTCKHNSGAKATCSCNAPKATLEDAACSCSGPSCKCMKTKGHCDCKAKKMQAKQSAEFKIMVPDYPVFPSLAGR
eukprot:gnl/TRDRNA2_/TRDRNA2_73953_c0_seq1.p1 gnl/TRDRNA2_/TRDRNA2_73953_c0~~gnl/TRDRNA2_/TRDRNA2_73953_c0_seq1.p1  ORF type:complete len:145 (-),score=11.51 gnl/TRDRNA2_/TRDRNA2_73953_c0_seq1:385-819(-)